MADMDIRKDSMYDLINFMLGYSQFCCNNEQPGSLKPDNSRTYFSLPMSFAHCYEALLSYQHSSHSATVAKKPGTLLVKVAEGKVHSSKSFMSDWMLNWTRIGHITHNSPSHGLTSPTGIRKHDASKFHEVEGLERYGKQHKWGGTIFVYNAHANLKARAESQWVKWEEEQRSRQEKQMSLPVLG